MTVEKVVRELHTKDQSNDVAYWQTHSYQSRLAALEQIRREYHSCTYDVEPRLQRVYSTA